MARTLKLEKSYVMIRILLIYDYCITDNIIGNKWIFDMSIRHSQELAALSDFFPQGWIPTTHSKFNC